MNTPGAALADAARSLSGTPFRLHGRDPQTGLDCVGLVAEALRRAGHAPVAPRGYRMRNTDLPDLLHHAAANGLIEVSGAHRPGDIALVRPGPAQVHLLIALGRGVYIHADARLERIALMPGPLAWPVLRHWRLIEPN